MRRAAGADERRTNQTTDRSSNRRNLAGACLAHLVHDGYTDQLYALLPIWQTEFGLSYAALAVVRALYSATMGGLQVWADRATGNMPVRSALVIATIIAAAGYVVVTLPFGLPTLCAGLVIAGLGSSIQHPRASLLVTACYADAPREPLGIYNFSGDLGKAILPAFVAALTPILPWRGVVGITALFGFVTAFLLLVVMPPQETRAQEAGQIKGRGGQGRGFALLLTIGACDTATRMGYLLFLPFLIQAKGGSEASVGVGLALLFVGGALGKACCGWLAQRLSVVLSVVLTEAATAALIVATVPLSRETTFLLLPVLGIVLNGTSSILYGTVPDLARPGDVGRAFAVFYTGVIGAGGLSPIIYGALADHAGRTVGIIASALTAAAIIPLAMMLTPVLEAARRS